MANLKTQLESKAETISASIVDQTCNDVGCEEIEKEVMNQIDTDLRNAMDVAHQVTDLMKETRVLEDTYLSFGLKELQWRWAPGRELQHHYKES